MFKSFGAIHAVRDVSIYVDQGEILGIAGANGSGKSTLLNVITKIPYKPDSGSIVLSGTNLSSLLPQQIVSHGLVRTFQRESILATSTAIDNVLTAAERLSPHLRMKECITRSIDALNELEFPLNWHNRVAALLPAFYQKLVMLASAIVLKPKLLLLDEPASGLNIEEIARLRNFIKIQNSRGLTIILVEHVLPLLTTVADRLVVMHEGVVISRGSITRVLEDPLVRESYLGANNGNS